ncbi:MAG: MFS transporter [Candidatus Pacebacteria bacterium]|nr:MFS transporter [Candidatus Paceibacterota bacterium]
MGKSRGLFLLVINTAWIVSPFLSWWIIGNKGFLTLYTLAALILSGVCVFALGNVSNFSEASYSHRSFFKSTKEVWARFDLRVIIIVQFFLQLFYAWMIVYTPLYLISIRGFSYASLGIVFSIMLLPFILLQLPLGIMADRRYGEKEIMSVGFVIMSLSTLIFAFNNHNQLWSFALILFCTRIGAAMVEVMSETYFFKIIGEQEPGLISLFRSISPLAYIVGMSVAIILLPIGGYTVLYSILALLLMIGALVSRYIHDTK